MTELEIHILGLITCGLTTFDALDDKLSLYAPMDIMDALSVLVGLNYIAGNVSEGYHVVPVEVRG